MAKPRNRDNLIKTIQEQYENLFSNQDEPPAPMGLREMEGLQARIAELEEELVRQSSNTKINLPEAAEITGSMIAASETYNFPTDRKPEIRDEIQEPSPSVKSAQTTQSLPKSTYRKGFLTSISARYTFFGILFGLMFPIFSVGTSPGYMEPR